MSSPRYRMEVVHLMRNYSQQWNFPDLPRKGDTVIVNDVATTAKVIGLLWDMPNYRLIIFVEDAD